MIEKGRRPHRGLGQSARHLQYSQAWKRCRTILSRKYSAPTVCTALTSTTSISRSSYRQMMKKIRIEDPGSTSLLLNKIVDKAELDAENAAVRARMEAGEEGLRFATGIQTLLGITKASLATDSFLSAASFQETTRVLTEAAIMRQDRPADRPEGKRHYRQTHPGRHAAWSSTATWKSSKMTATSPKSLTLSIDNTGPKLYNI